MCCFLCFFFFFKQKTAYEMRISDWSSDVCSSDLIVDSRGRTRGTPVEPDREDESMISVDTFVGSPGSFMYSAHLIAGEIGRASCRERVCQYGVDLGGRRIIKKKKPIKARCQ